MIEEVHMSELNNKELIHLGLRDTKFVNMHLISIILRKVRKIIIKFEYICFYINMLSSSLEAMSKTTSPQIALPLDDMKYFSSQFEEEEKLFSNKSCGTFADF